MNPLWNNPALPPEPNFSTAAVFMAMLFALVYLVGYTYAGGRRAALVSIAALMLSYPVIHTAAIAAQTVYVSLLVLLTLIVHSMSQKKVATGVCLLTSGLACALSPQALALPLLMVLCDWARGKKTEFTNTQMLRYTLTGAIAVSAALLLTPAIPMASNAEPAPAGLLAINGAKVFLEYLTLWVWPFQGDGVITPVYTRYTGYTNMLYWVILILVIRHTWRLGKHNRWMLAGLGWTCLTLIPVCGFWTGGGPVFALEYLLLPILGLSLMLGHSAKRSSTQVRDLNTSTAKRIMHGSFLAVLTLWLGGHAWASIQYMSNWGQPLARLEQAVTRQPANFAAATELARLYSRNGQHQKAEDLILQIQDMAPWYPEIYYVHAEYRLHRSGQEEAASALRSLVLNYFPDEIRARRLYESLQSPSQQLMIDEALQ